MHQFSVLTVNLLNDDYKKAERVQLFIEQVNELDPDIIALQEVDLEQGVDKAILKSFKNYDFIVSSRTDHLHQKEGLMILSRFKILDSKTVRLDKQQRVAQQIIVKIGNRDVSIVHVHMHWSILSDRVRRKHLLKLLDVNPSPQILLGDFNAIHRMQSIKLLLKKYKSSTSQKGSETYPSPFKRHGLRAFVRHNSILILGFLSSFRFRSWKGTIDYIFIDESINLISSEVVFMLPSKSNPNIYVSDHFGILAKLNTK